MTSLVTTKQCTSCAAIVPKTAPACGYCHRRFVGKWNKHPERPIGKPGRKTGISPGRKPRVDIDAPATDGAIDRILAAADARREATASAVPADGGFTPRLNGGALAIVWTRWGVEFALTPDETAAVRRALT